MWLNRIRDRLVIRVAAADPQHPLRRRWKSARFRWIQARQDIELAGWTLMPPWDPLNKSRTQDEVAAVGQKRGIGTFTAWKQQVQPLDMVVYSDGALQNRRAGAGYCIFQGQHTMIGKGSIPLGYTAKIYDAEVIRAVEGLCAALASPMARYATNLTVCLDNKEATMRLQSSVPTATSYKEIMNFRAAVTAWHTRDRGTLTFMGPGTISIRWCPGHQGFKGNEIADKLAGEAYQLPTIRHTMSIARAKTVLKTRYREAFSEYWTQNMPDRYRTLGLSIIAHPPPELKLPRQLGHLLASRSGHGDFATYHQRFNHKEAQLKCLCGHDKEPEHFYCCRRVARGLCFRAPKSNTTKETIQWAFGTVEGAIAFARWCNRTAFYHNISSRSPISGTNVANSQPGRA